MYQGLVSGVRADAEEDSQMTKAGDHHHGNIAYRLRIPQLHDSH
jgi:hypothetical protein